MSDRYANGHPGNAAAIRAYSYAPGVSGNPSGKPKKARNQLQNAFLKALAKDFDAHGEEALRRCREEDPPAYIRAIVALMPKELEITREFDDLTDEQLEAAVAAARSLIAARDSGAGAGEQAISEPATGLPAVHEAG